MEFNKKLAELRKQKGWTQEELAEALYVSRTAVSKWESGRGYPSIDSLKAIARLFSVSVDELLSNDELIDAAQTDAREKANKKDTVIFGLVDCMVGLLMIFPFFSQQAGEGYKAVSLMNLTDISSAVKGLYIAVIAASVFFGALQLALQNSEKSFWKKQRSSVSILLSVFALFLFILGSMPYAGAFLLFILLIKGFLMVKSR